MSSTHTSALFRALGVDATHEGADVRVIVERGVQVWEGTTVVRENHLSVRTSEVSDPKRGDVFTVDSETWTLSERVDGDGVIAKFAARIS